MVAFAIAVQKSEVMPHYLVDIDPFKAFEVGEVYIALSRRRNLEEILF